MGDLQSRQRGQILREARTLAKTGRHRDFEQVLGAMTGPRTIDVRCAWLSDARFVDQINRMCLIYADRVAQSAAAPSTRRRAPAARRPDA